MGICYELFLLDEFNWNYHRWNKAMTIAQVKALCPHAELIADIRGLMIFDIDKTPPLAFADKVTADAIKYRSDTDLLSIYDLEAPSPENKKAQGGEP